MSLEDRKHSCRCQVSGCRADLGLEGRHYHVQKRICAKHMQAEAVMCRGQADELFRFCFQCGKLEPLSAFDGARRACRAKLQLRRARKAASNPNLGSGLPSLGLMPADIAFKSEQVEEQWLSDDTSAAAAAGMAWAPATAMPAASHHSLQGVSALAIGAPHQLPVVSAAAWEHQHQQRQQQYTNSPFSVPLCSSSAAVGMVQGMQRAATCPAAMVAAGLYGGAGPSVSFTGVPPAVAQGGGGGGGGGGSRGGSAAAAVTDGAALDAFDEMLADMLVRELLAGGRAHSPDGSCGTASMQAHSGLVPSTLAAAAAAASGGDCSTSSIGAGLAPGPAQQQQFVQQQPQPQQPAGQGASASLQRLADVLTPPWEQAQHPAAALGGVTAAAVGVRPPPMLAGAPAGSVPVHAPGAVPALQPAHAATRVADLEQQIAAAEAQLEAMWAFLRRVSARGPPM